MLITLHIEHVIPDIHVVYVVVAYEMERLTKSLASKGLLIPISQVHDSMNLTFGECNLLRIVFIRIMSNFD